MFFFFFSSRRRHTRYWRDWSSDVCSSDLAIERARKAEPKSTEFMDTAAEVRWRQGKQAEAIALLEQAHKAVPNDEYIAARLVSLRKAAPGAARGLDVPRQVARQVEEHLLLDRLEVAHLRVLEEAEPLDQVLHEMLGR